MNQWSTEVFVEQPLASPRSAKKYTFIYIYIYIYIFISTRWSQIFWPGWFTGSKRYLSFMFLFKPFSRFLLILHRHHSWRQFSKCAQVSLVDALMQGFIWINVKYNCCFARLNTVKDCDLLLVLIQILSGVTELKTLFICGTEGALERIDR